MHRAQRKVWLFGERCEIPPNANAGFKSKQPASKPAAGDKKHQSDLAGGMGNLSVAEKVNVKSKNLDVLSEYQKSNRKKSANFVVIG